MCKWDRLQVSHQEAHEKGIRGKRGREEKSPNTTFCFTFSRICMHLARPQTKCFEKYFQWKTLFDYRQHDLNSVLHYINKCSNHEWFVQTRLFSSILLEPWRLILLSRIFDRLVTFSPHNPDPNVMDTSAADSRTIGSGDWIVESWLRKLLLHSATK